LAYSGFLRNFVTTQFLLNWAANNVVQVSASEKLFQGLRTIFFRVKKQTGQFYKFLGEKKNSM
jgi:hypothetical protein